MTAEAKKKADRSRSNPSQGERTSIWVKRELKTLLQNQMTQKKRIRKENLSAASSDQLGCSGPSMNVSISRESGGANASNDCVESSSARGIDALSVGQSNTGLAFYQKRRKTKDLALMDCSIACNI